MNILHTALYPVPMRTAVDVLRKASADNVKGSLVKRFRSGRELRLYTISGHAYKINAWPSEHTV